MRRDALLIQFMMVGVCLLFFCGAAWVVMWLFEIGNMSKLEMISKWLGTYTGVMILLNLLFNRFFKDI